MERLNLHDAGFARLSLLMAMLLTFACTERQIRLQSEEAEADQAAGRIEEAIDHYRQILELDPTNLPARIDLGFLHASKGRPDSALYHYELAIRVDSTMAEPHYNSGVLYVGIGEMDSARAAYERAVRHDTEHVQAHNNLGTLLERRGRVDEALEHYERATEVDSSFALAWVNVGRVRFLMRRMEEAVEAYTTALSLNEDLPEAHAALASVYLEADDFGKAIHHLGEAARLAPDSPAKNSLAEVRAMREDRDRRRAAGEMRARHIVVGDEGFAYILLKKVQSGEDFGTLARAHSIDPTARSGGDLGAFQPGDLLPAFEQMVKRLAPNEIGGPIQTALGWHIIQRVY